MALTKTDLTRMSLRELSALIQAGNVSAEEIMQTIIAETEKQNRRTNAAVKIYQKAAIARARETDSLKTRSLFAGLPVSIKESFAIRGRPHSAGVYERKDYLGVQTSPAVTNLQNAGMIPYCQTNTSEFCLWSETENHVYGLTNNPYNTDFTAGGSSGGEGAVIGSGASICGLGSDIAGSIRMPAVFNGIYGHKPTGGTVSVEGHFPITYGEALNYLVAGPMCRYAEDLWPLYQILKGEEPGENPEPEDPSRWRVLVVENKVGRFTREPTIEINRATEKIVTALRDENAHIEYITIEELEDAFEIWFAMLEHANGGAVTELLEGINSSFANEWFKFLTGSSKRTLPVFMAMNSLKAMSFFGGRVEQFYRKGLELQNKLDRLLQPDTLMLLPAYPSTAQKHGNSMMTFFDWAYSAIFNVMNLPATALPTGLAINSLPTGLQVVGARNNDKLTIRFAEWSSRITGGWTPPPVSFENR